MQFCHFFFFFQAEDGIRDLIVTGVQTCALPIYFDVSEYRGNKYSPAQFPDGVETRGLPSMALIFHPNNVGSFALSCEGLRSEERRVGKECRSRWSPYH